MATVQDIYNAALAIMNETGTGNHNDYEGRTPALINMLIGDLWQVSEEYETGPHSMWRPVSAMSDEVEGIDATLALSVMPLGLASYLYLDEDPVRAGSWWGIYLERKEQSRHSPARTQPIEDVYGGIEYGNYGRW